jgi:hypothetical protein
MGGRPVFVACYNDGAGRMSDDAEVTCLQVVEAADRDAADGSITVYPDGPLLVRGDVRIENPDGSAIPHTRRTVALCRCGKSALKPWCDGTHKVARFTAP